MRVSSVKYVPGVATEYFLYAISLVHFNISKTTFNWIIKKILKYFSLPFLRNKLIGKLKILKWVQGKTHLNQWKKFNNTNRIGEDHAFSI